MHGKINYYSSSSGAGTIMDNLKKAYDFKLVSWHDTSSIPTVGMYVVYQLDDREKVSDIKSSKYQSFKNNIFLNEADFWGTNDDIQLEELEDKRREDIVSAKVKELESALDKITEINPAKTPQECMRHIFSKHYELLDENNGLMQGDVAFEFDYAVLKRFLEKTMLQLTTLDKRITQDEFADIRQKIVKAEHLYGILEKIADPDDASMTKNYFLKYQIEYVAILRAYGNLRDKMVMLNNRTKSLEVELPSLVNKIRATDEDSEKDRLRALVAKKKDEKTQMDSEIATSTPIQENLRQILQDFEKKYTEEFPTFYKENKELLKKSFGKLINRLADAFDTRLYKKATMSEVIISSFYSQAVDGTFSTMTFVKYYLMRLNKDLMKDTDKILYNTFLKYQKSMTVKFAVVTGDVTLGQKLKISLLSQNKHIRVTVFSRAIEFYSTYANEAFAMIFVDTKLRGSDPVELVEKGRASAKNADAVYVVFDS